jgi:hypothetical protein
MMFFQETTPDTSGYMIAGYVIAFLVMALYVASIYIRTRNLHQDMRALHEIEAPAQMVESNTGTLKKSLADPPGNRSAKTVTKTSKKK